MVLSYFSASCQTEIVIHFLFALPLICGIAFVKGYHAPSKPGGNICQKSGGILSAFANSGNTTPAAPASAKCARGVNGVGRGLISTTVAPLRNASIGSAAAG